MREILEKLLRRESLDISETGQLFDDLIGRELTHLADLLELPLDIRERDYFEPAGGGGGWYAAS